MPPSRGWRRPGPTGDFLILRHLLSTREEQAREVERDAEREFQDCSDVARGEVHNLILLQLFAPNLPPLITLTDHRACR